MIHRPEPAPLPCQLLGPDGKPLPLTARPVPHQQTRGELALAEAGAKMAAKLMLAGRRGIVVPEAIEWVGVNLLERDDELPRR